MDDPNAQRLKQPLQSFMQLNVAEANVLAQHIAQHVCAMPGKNMKPANTISQTPEVYACFFAPDESPDLSFLEQDEIPAKVKQEIYDRANNDGVWIMVGQYFDGEEWIDADSVGGFIGDDWKNSGYDVDVMAATLEQAANLKHCECCKRPIKQTA